MAEVLRHADHLVFNSFSQWRAFRPLLERRREGGGRPVQCGLRLNPEHSEGTAALYDPCAPGSRLGIRARETDAELKRDADVLRGLHGMHFHTLCEQDADALERTLDALEGKFRPVFTAMGTRFRWLNFGGGHHITRPGYDLDRLCRCIEHMRDAYRVQIYLEPGEAVALNAGVLLATVLDVVQADLPVAILDISVACHMPDVLEMPYRPGVAGAGAPGEKAWTCRLGGKSCLAGDVAGEYSFDAPLLPGDRLAFTDMAIYSMVKTSTFNGLRLPSIAVWDSETDALEVTRTFGYEDFRGRL
jgi:carboxynorspermidine decarboxylase